MGNEAVQADNWVNLTEQNKLNGEPILVAMIIDAMLRAKGPEPYPGCTDQIKEAFRVLYEIRYGIWLDGDLITAIQAEAEEASKCDFVGSING